LRFHQTDTKVSGTFAHAPAQTREAVTVTKRLEWTSSSGASSMRFRESFMSYLPSIWIWLGIIACITLSALFAGLNLAIFSLSQLRLQIEADSGNKDAVRVLDLRRNSNQVLATVIWGNVGTNVFLTLLSDSVLAGLGAFFFSVVVITLFGEIAPQAYFSRNALDDGTIFAVPDFLARRVVLRRQADSDTARLVARS